MRECDLKSLGSQREVAKPKVKSTILFTLFRILLLRSFVKWVTRKIFGFCELQRIIRNFKFSERNDRLEQSLLLSKHDTLRDALHITNLKEIPEVVSKIMYVKRIVPETDPPFEQSLRLTLYQINGYRNLFEEIEAARKMCYNCDNDNHEDMLLKLWKLLKPDEQLESRVCKGWRQLGFQGTDPQTDFRGMGVLGLKCMVYFAENHTKKARQVIQHSLHPTLGYSYAIVSINITSLMYEMLQAGLLRCHFYNEVQGVPTIDDFLHAFSCAFEQFDRFWIESKPENVMAFGRVRENFALELAMYLSPPRYGSLKMDE